MVFVIFVVRRSTRGKRGVRDSDKEADEPEICAEADQATTSIQESLAVDPVDKSEFQKHGAPDTSSTEPVSSGADDEHSRSKDDNTGKSESAVIDVPVAEKNAASKGMPEQPVVDIDNGPFI